METPSHKWLDAAQHLWPYVSGVFITMIAVVKLWWSDRKETKRRITNVELIAETAVTEARLQECKTDVLVHDATVEERILEELKILAQETKELRADMREDNQANAKQHQDILTEVVRLHSK